VNVNDVMLHFVGLGTVNDVVLCDNYILNKPPEIAYDNVLSCAYKISNEGKKRYQLIQPALVDWDGNQGKIIEKGEIIR